MRWSKKNLPKSVCETSNFKDGLIFTSIEITYNSKSKVINNMVIDLKNLKKGRAENE